MYRVLLFKQSLTTSWHAPSETPSQHVCRPLFFMHPQPTPVLLTPPAIWKTGELTVSHYLK